jgi:signal transduction histidine kinase
MAGCSLPRKKGVVLVDSTKVRGNPSAPNVLIEEIRLNDNALERRPHNRDERLVEIGPGVRSLEFAFAAPSFTAPDKVRVRYRIEGLDAEWREAHDSRTASYLHLAPGDYRFRVIASDADGAWNGAGAALPFRVRAYFWQERWFIVVAVLFFAAATAGLARWWSLLRVRRQVRQMAQRHAVEQERTRIAKDLHDELGASLTHVTLLSELAHQELGDPGKARARVEAIRTASSGMARALDEIVWSVSPRNDDLEHLVGYVSQFSNEYLKPAGILCRQEVPVVTPARPLPAEVRHHVFLAVKETLHNIVQHARATEVRLTIRIEQHALEIVIEDNGCGFAPGDERATRRADRGHGLLNLHERLRTVSGSCVIHSEPEVGTSVCLKIPLASS